MCVLPRTWTFSTEPSLATITSTAGPVLTRQGRSPDATGGVGGTTSASAAEYTVWSSGLIRTASTTMSSSPAATPSGDRSTGGASTTTGAAAGSTGAAAGFGATLARRRGAAGFSAGGDGGGGGSSAFAGVPSASVRFETTAPAVLSALARSVAAGSPSFPTVSSPLHAAVINTNARLEAPRYRLLIVNFHARMGSGDRKERATLSTGNQVRSCATSNG